MKLDEQACAECAVGYHFDCINPKAEDDCCCPETQPLLGGLPATEGESTGRAHKSDEDVKDRQSTGRKRAAEEYPIDKGKTTCEWRNLNFAGGGFAPIIGCFAGMAAARHHGPDKNTLNNSPGNVHRICHTCHNRWHTLNDPFYAEKFGTPEWKAHDPSTKVDYKDQLENETKWKTGTRKTVEVGED